MKNYDNLLDYLDSFDVIIDVRSPHEYNLSHIPESINMPIFSDEEHKMIGTIYKTNKTQANFLGASKACQNISRLLLEYAEILDYKKRILLYCARGGNRSLAFYQVLKALHLRVERLEGGYKAYRSYVVNTLESSEFYDNIKFLTLCGNTGCGKSDIVQLARDWSIDIESLCVHYGSTFGFMAGTQPSNKAFQNVLLKELNNKKSHIILIENESKKLGDIILPNALCDAYKKAPKILITASMENRVDRIVKMYQNITQEDFMRCMNHISTYISNVTKLKIIDLWNLGDISQVVEILLSEYYDKVYRKSTFEYQVNSDDIQNAYEEIKVIANLFLAHD